MPGIDSGVLKTIAIGDADEAIPTLPSKNATDITYTGNWSAKDFDLSNEEITLEMVDKEAVDLKSPEKSGRWERIIQGGNILMVEVVPYEFGEKIMEVCTNRTNSPTGTFIEETVHATKKAVIIEFSKMGIIYMPIVQIECDDPIAGLQVAAHHVLRFHAIYSTTLGASSKFMMFQP